ncbi:polysaccharide biosynthesis tyrosine autokinase [Algivirga pacifica]|uniref:non-specific protein-tyrosine kinase n=1 Tax=Algivirga pacifica TaxID=1162670 RepID=A0ABP9DAL5_9BACT
MSTDFKVQEQAQGYSPQGVEIDFDKLRFVIFKSLLWIILIFGIASAIAYMYLRWTPMTYNAYSIIKLEVQSSKNFLNQEYSVYSGISYESVNMSGEIELLKSDLMYESVMDSLDLSVSYYSLGEISYTELYNQTPFEVHYQSYDHQFYGEGYIVQILDEQQFELKYEEDGNKQSKTYLFGNTIQLKHGEITVNLKRPLLEESLALSYKFVPHPKEEIKRFLNQNLNVNIDNRKANTLIVSFEANNKNKAVAIVDAFIRNYKEKTISNKNQGHKQMLHYLSQQQTIVKDSLSRYEQLYKNYTSLSQFSGLKDQEEILNRVQELEQQNALLGTNIKNYENILTLIADDSSAIYLEAIANVIEDEQLSGLVKTIRAMETNLDRVTISYTTETIARKQQEDLLKANHNALSELANFRITLLKENIIENRKVIQKLQKTFYSNIGGDPVLKRINKNMNVYEDMASLFASKIIEVNIVKASTVEGFRTIAPATASSTPVAPIPSKVIGLSIAASFFLSIIMILVRYIAHNKIYSIKQIEKQTNAPILGVVPEYQKEEMNFSQLVIHKNPKSSISEAFRSLRTNLDFLQSVQQDNQNKIISVTSTISGEGKTFVSANLAGMIALSGARVVLLDLDLRKPKIHLAFNEDNTQGVSSLLVQQASIGECLRDTEIDNLKFITAGPIPPNPAELILSNAFDQLLEDLKKQFDIIMFDTPPVGLVTDGIIAMRHASVPIYVTRAEYSKTSFVKNINHIIDNKKFKNLSIVLNCVPARKGYSNYDYGYGYGYGYGGYHYGGDGYYEEAPPKKKFPFNLFS